MKKSLVIICFGIGLFASCKKDRICECTDQNGQIDRIEYEKVTKKWMVNSAECVSYTYTYNNGSGEFTGKVNCEIK